MRKVCVEDGWVDLDLCVPACSVYRGFDFDFEVAIRDSLFRTPGGKWLLQINKPYSVEFVDESKALELFRDADEVAESFKCFEKRFDLTHAPDKRHDRDDLNPEPTCSVDYTPGSLAALAEAEAAESLMRREHDPETIRQAETAATTDEPLVDTAADPVTSPAASPIADGAPDGTTPRVDGPIVDTRASDSSPVTLKGEGERPIVLGRSKPPLTKPQYAVIKALLDVAIGTPMSGEELSRKSGRDGAVRILSRLRDSDPDWGSVIHKPGQPWKGYKIDWPTTETGPKIGERPEKRPEKRPNIPKTTGKTTKNPRSSIA